MSNASRSNTGPTPTYVTRISFDGGLRVTFDGRVNRRALAHVGGKKQLFRPTWKFDAPDDAAAARILAALRDLGFPLLGPSMGAWSPSEVFEDYRERGLLTGRYQMLVYTGHGWRIHES